MTEPREYVVLPRTALMEFFGSLLPTGDVDCAPVAERIIAWVETHDLTDLEEYELDVEMRAALGRLRWVVPGRAYNPQLVADVRLVLQHFGLDNANHGEPDS